MAVPLKDGLPRKAFAYAPTADPADWKLPIYNADGSVDPDRLPGAAAALSEGGFRGQKADIPSDALTNTKAKIRMAYRKWKGRDAEYPDSIKESIMREGNADGVHTGIVIREATMLLNRSSVQASVVFLPNGDTVVVPGYDGQFWAATQPWVAPKMDTEPTTDYTAKYDAQDAAALLAKLYQLKGGEDDQPEQMAMLDKAIAGVLAFLKAEGDEIGQPMTAAESARSLGAMIAEAGKRNSMGDMGMIQTIHDQTMKLGAVCPTGYAEAEVVITPDAKPAEVAFLESAGDGAAVVTLAEANPIFDREHKTVTITPIRVGWGNKRDNYYYPAGALHEAVDNGLFNGIKMYRDHPRKSDEKDLPERSVKDWFATTQEAHWDDGRQEPRLTIKVHDNDVLTRFEEAPEQIAFSVLGQGLARPGTVAGKDGKVVESFAHVKSVDWVTQAGAGGALAFAESAAEEHAQMELDLQKLTADQLKEANPALYAELTGMKEHDEAPAAPEAEGKPEAEAETPAPAEAPATETKTTTETTTETPAEPAEDKAVAESAPAGFVSKADFDALAARFDAKETAVAAKAAAKPVIAAVIAESTLPGKAKAVIAANFAEASWGGGSVYTDQPTLEKAVRGQLALAASLLGAPATKVKGLGGDSDTDDEGTSVREAVAERIGSRWGTEAIPKARSTVFEQGEEPVAPAAPEAPAAVTEASASQQVEDRLAAKFH